MGLDGNAGIGLSPTVKISQAAEGRHLSQLRAKIVIRDAEGNITFTEEQVYGPDHVDGSNVAYMLLNGTNIFDQAFTITDVGNTGRSIAVNSASTVLVVVAGNTGTAPAFADHALGDGTTNTDYKTNSSYCNATSSVTQSSNTLVIVGTITCSVGGGNTYKEIGMACTVATFQFLLCHDQLNGGTGFLVSQNGTLQITYTGTFT